MSCLVRNFCHFWRNSSGEASNRFCHCCHSSPPASPIARHSASNGAGISNGGCAQDKASRVAAISSSPNGDPCTFAEPCLFGAPCPITVLHAIKDGFADFCAAAMACLISSWLCPSIAIVSQPYAAKRCK